MKKLIRELLWTYKYMLKDHSFVEFVETVIAAYEDIIKKNKDDK